MTDDLVERLLDWPYQGETMAEEAAVLIKQLTTERDKWKTAFDESCNAWQQQCEYEMDRAKKAEAERDDAFECNEQFFVDNQFLKKRAEKAEAERDRLREALRDGRRLLAIAQDDRVRLLIQLEQCEKRHD